MWIVAQLRLYTMAVWSTLARSATQNLQCSRLVLPASRFTINNAIISLPQIRKSSNMVITASRWQWHKTKDLLHFYFMVAAIPLGILTFCVNVFVGPATLTEIPEGYEPKYWEYYRHPISRFLARYIFNNPQKDYEKNLHAIYVESQIMKIRQLEEKIWALQAERQDYQYNYFAPFYMFPIRENRELIKHDRDGLE